MLKKAAIVFVLAAITTGALAVDAAAQGRGYKTIWDGVYAAEQADRGRSVYLRSCMGCHGRNMDETPGEGQQGIALKGDAFIDRWREDTLEFFFNYVKNHVPRGSEGAVRGVTADQRRDLVAFILRENGAKPGTTDINADVVAGIRFERQTGPAALPDRTLVRAVGCLKTSGPGQWSISNTTEPVRTRESNLMLDQELAEAKSNSLGSLAFNLPDLEFSVLDFNASASVGHKVLVKGVVYRAENPRITPLAVQSIASSCQ
jgi:S-disulfanyl-L-cysteine oxidoreductase SoxD